jgi:Domain of unknown function (DUF4062)
MAIPHSVSRARAQAYQVFLSSTFNDLASERKAVCAALAELNIPLASVGVCLIPIDLQPGADTQPPLEVCLERLDVCDLVVILVGHRAGFITPDGRSITEREFDHAKDMNIPRLAYLRDGSTPILQEYVDKDDKCVAVLNRLKSKIDESLKRDTFNGPEHLRGHILRDVLGWVLNQPVVKDRLERLPAPSTLPEIKNIFDALQQGDTDKAVDLVTSHRFALEMRRYGTDAIRREILCDLLELGGLSLPTRVTDKSRRSQLLFSLLSDFPQSLLAAAALEEAKSLEVVFNKPEYSFHVARAEARLHVRCDRSHPALRKMLLSAWRSRDRHVLAQARQTVASHYGTRGQHFRAVRWYWKSITILCGMKDICPHCLGLAFLGAACESLSCHNCAMTDDRLLKALLIGRIIPDRQLQFSSLHQLSGHLAAHNALDEAVACAVVAARLASETWLEDKETSLSAILAELVAKQGRETVTKSLKRVEATGAESMLDALIHRYKLEGFTQSLDLKPSSAGDHW